MILHGFALPFGMTILYGDSYLQVASGAFDRWLKASGGGCRLVLFGHNDAINEQIATTADRSLKLFADARGLWFRAAVRELTRGGTSIQRLVTQRHTPLDQVSVNIIATGEVEDRSLGIARRTIIAASADHVALTHKAAWGKKTGAWPADVPLALAPFHIRDLAAEFNRHLGRR